MNKFAIFFIFNLFLTYVNSAPKKVSREPICIFDTKVDGMDMAFMRHNFSELSNPEEDIVVQRSDKETIHIQLCSRLRNGCNGEHTYSICLKKGNWERGIGKAPPRVMNENGKIMYNFTGDNCEGNTKYRVIISMKCDYLALNDTIPELLPQEDHCIFNMVWRTVLACTEAKEINCTLQDEKYNYDLSPLKRYSENYVIQISNETYPKIILNVCHSVIYGPDALCLRMSGACLQLSENSYEPLGQIQNPPSLVSGNLTLAYEAGSTCKKNVDVILTSIGITFICDHHAEDTVPTYVGGEEVCNYQLIWKTKAACSVESLRENRAVLPSNCTVINPFTKFIYNMNALATKDSTASLDSVEYRFRVCGSQEDKACKPGSGNCVVKSATSFGMANANLMWKRGGPYLNYTNGDTCENGQKRFTVIAFLCGKKGSMPIVVDSRPCQVTINWMTELACENTVKCLTDNNEVNLTPLIRFSDNYVVKTNITEFHINVCRPLTPKPGLLCPPGGAVCRIAPISKDKYTEGTNLGYSEEKPFIIDEHKVGLRYTGGSVCKENSNKTISTNLTFLCENSNQKGPEYKGYSDCTYLFEWKTNIVCREGVTGSWTPPCTVKDEHSHEFNISALYNGQVRTVTNKKGEKYNIDICGGHTCGGSAICLNNKGYGSMGKITVDHSRNSISLKYFNNTVCNDSSYMSEIRLVCNASSGIGSPELLWETDCSVGFEWQTQRICEDHPRVKILDATPSNPPIVSETVTVLQPVKSSETVTVQPVQSREAEEHGSSNSETGLIIALVLTSIAILAGLIYCWKRERRDRFCPPWNSFGMRRSDSRVQYCRVNTVEEARLLLDTSDPTECFSDSDDALLDA